MAAPPDYAMYAQLASAQGLMPGFGAQHAAQGYAPAPAATHMPYAQHTGAMAPAAPRPAFQSAAGYGMAMPGAYSTMQAQPYGMQAPAAGYGAPAAPSYGSSTDELRTIFITGFPSDMKDRELNNLLRFLPGYEASQLNWKNGLAQGFAMFSTGAMARAACDTVTQLCFDPSTVLRCEMARKNMYIKEDANKRPRTSTYTGAAAAGGAGGAGAAPPPSSGGPSSGDNPPGNTLYIGNLGTAVQEEELRAVFGFAPGFRNLKLVHGPRSVNCFVEYEDVASAQAVHASKQGVTIASSDKGPLRVQFSKNPFGKKRDRDAGAFADTGL